MAEIENLPKKIIEDGENEGKKIKENAHITSSKIIEKNKRIFSDMLLNVNIPHSPRGVRITKLGRREYENVVEEGKKGYLIGGDRKELIEAGTDFEACKKGYISVTPLLTDLTHYEAIKALKSWKF